MNMDLRKLLADSAQEIKIIIKRKLRINASLNKNLGTAEINQLLDFLKNSFMRKSVGFRMAGRPVEGTKIAVHYAGIGITHVSVHNKCHLGMPRPHAPDHGL